MEKVFTKIISGGQTGVDRAALDVALELGISCGGWCPKGRRAEDGTIPFHYPLQEVASRDYRVRTEKNVVAADGTLILTWGKPMGGTALTIKLAEKHRKPFLVIDSGRELNPVIVWKWGQAYSIQMLNVAGPRESEVPGIHARTAAFLKEVFKKEKGSSGILPNECTGSINQTRDH
jgi:hypothetical protein